MRALALVTLFLLVPVSLLAESRHTASLTVDSSTPGSCPVSFDVRRNSPGLVANVEDPGGRHPSSQRVYFKLQPSDQRTVRSIRITVHALSPQPRVYPAGTLSEPAPTIDRDFEIADSASVFRNGRNLWVNGVGGIRSVDLTAIAYTDGSSWHASPVSICHAIPNGFTLVNLISSR